MKKTAVDYLFEKLWGIPKDKFTWQMILNEAKKKEKEQIMRTGFDFQIDALKKISKTSEGYLEEAELYYKQTYEQ